MRWTEDDLKMVEERIANARNKNRAAIPVDNVEQAISDGTLGAQKIPRLDSPCHVHFHSLRHRLCDADGISGKAVLDGLVLSGIFPDDSPEYIKEVTYSQEKISRKENEETIITIAWAENTPNSPVERKQGKGKEKLS